MITICWPSTLPSIYSALSRSRVIRLTAVPCFATMLDPFTLRSLTSTTESPFSRITPLTSRWTTVSAGSSPSPVALAHTRVCSSRYIISKRSWVQPSDLRRLSILQATTFTASCSLHMLSLRLLQWLGSTVSGSSNCPMQVTQPKRLPSNPPVDIGGTSYTFKSPVAPQSSHWLPLLFCRSSINPIVSIF